MLVTPHNTGFQSIATIANKHKNKTVSQFVDHLRRRDMTPSQRKTYDTFFREHGHHFDWLADIFHQGEVRPPYCERKIVDFIGDTMGFEVVPRAYTFNTNDLFARMKIDGFSGYWDWQSKKTRDKCYLNINAKDDPRRQRFSLVHEVTHPVQDLDHIFQQYLQPLPAVLRLSLTEALADRNAARMLAPPDQVRRYREESYSDAEIADIFQVSLQVIQFTR